MGDIADMMMDGTLCHGCGVYMEGEPGGIPRYCSHECLGDVGDAVAEAMNGDAPAKANPRTNCQTCGKRVKKAGLKDHMRDAHGVTR